MFAFAANGSVSGVSEIADPSTKFSVVKDNAATINVYIEDGSLMLQNKTAATVYLSIDAVGLFKE